MVSDRGAEWQHFCPSSTLTSSNHKPGSFLPFFHQPPLSVLGGCRPWETWPAENRFLLLSDLFPSTSRAWCSFTACFLVVAQLKLLPLLCASCCCLTHLTSAHLLHTPALFLPYSLFFPASSRALPLTQLTQSEVCFSGSCASSTDFCHWCCHGAWLIKWSLIHDPSAWA